jgi:hypothetical protein
MTSTRIMKGDFPCINSCPTISSTLGERHVSVLGMCTYFNVVHSQLSQVVYAVPWIHTTSGITSVDTNTAEKRVTPFDGEMFFFSELNVLVCTFYSTATFWQRPTLCTAYTRISLHYVLDSLRITTIIVR